MQDKIQAQLQERIEAFAADVTAILQAAVADAVKEALGGSAGAGRGKRGRPAKAAGAPKTAGRRKKGQKRTPEELEQLTANLYKEISKEGGRRIEQIAETMGVSTKDLALPVKKLLDEKKLKTKGQRRGMTYAAK